MARRAKFVEHDGTVKDAFIIAFHDKAETVATLAINRIRPSGREVLKTYEHVQSGGREIPGTWWWDEGGYDA